jgi:hypothetical protein
LAGFSPDFPARLRIQWPGRQRGAQVQLRVCGTEADWPLAVASVKIARIVDAGTGQIDHLILGALLDAVAHWVASRELRSAGPATAHGRFRALGHSMRERISPAGTLETAHYNNRRDAIENIIDADPVAAHVRELMADRAQWTGSASDLLQVGINVGGNAMAAWTRSGWPKSPRALAGRLRRAQTFLRTLGIEIVFGREGRLGTRTIRITAKGENRTHNTVSTVSRADDADDGNAK